MTLFDKILQLVCCCHWEKWVL